MVVKLSSSDCSTHEEIERESAQTACVRDSVQQLRAADIVGARRAAELAAAITYADAAPAPHPLPVRSFAPCTGVRVRQKSIIRRRFTEQEQARLDALDQAVREACAVFARDRGPRPAERLAMAWQFTLCNPFTDYPDEKVRTRPALPSGAAVDRAARVFEIVFALKAEDEFAAFLVIARAQGVPWKAIAARDPKRRRRTQLYVRRENALARMLTLAAERNLALI